MCIIKFHIFQLLFYQIILLWQYYEFFKTFYNHLFSTLLYYFFNLLFIKKQFDKFQKKHEINFIKMELFLIIYSCY